MGIRSELKQKTHNLILEKTALLLDKKGFLNVSSKEIAKECNVSQGSIFLHFKTKENLLNMILSNNITHFENSLKNSLLPELKSDIFLKKYLYKLNIGDIITQDNKRKNTLLCKRFYCIFNYVIIIAGVAQLVEQLICNQ